MFPFHFTKIHSDEAGLYFHDGEFQGILDEGRYWFFDPLSRIRIDVVPLRNPRLAHEKLDVIVRSGALDGRAIVVDLKDHERALVWIDGRFSQILTPGLHAFWNGPKHVRVEIVDARGVRFEHPDLRVITRAPLAAQSLDICSVERHKIGVLFIDGECVDTLPPGQYAFWRGVAPATVVEVDLRETMLDVSGQEIMTADKVTLRLNAVVTYRIADARRAVVQTDDVRQALYREAQLALRGVIGARDLDSLLTDKDVVGSVAEELVRRRAEEIGVRLISVGLRDVILPGDMKDLMNKVTEARKAAEANLISRREETAAMRSQANTARLLADNPVLMRLRELEVLEKVAGSGKLNIVLGEKGLAEKVVNLL